MAQVLLHPHAPYLATIDHRAIEATVWKITERGSLERRLAIPVGCDETELRKHFQSLPGATATFHPQRDLIAVAGKLREAEVWSLTSHSRELTLERLCFAPSLCYSADGRFLLAADWVRSSTKDPLEQNPYTAVYNESGERIGKCTRSDTAYARHPDGKIIAFAQNEQGEFLVKFFRIDDGDTVVKHRGMIDASGEIRGLAFSPDGKWLAVAVENPRRLAIEVYTFPDFEKRLEHTALNPSTTAYLPFGSRSFLTRQMPFRSDSQAVYSLSFDGRLLEHEFGAKGPRVLAQAHDGFASTIDVRYSDNLLVTGGTDGFIRLWR